MRLIWSQSRLERIFYSLRKSGSRKLCSSVLEPFFPDLRRKVDPISGVPIIHTQNYVCELPPGHTFPMGKFIGVFECLIKDGVIDPKAQVLEPPQITSGLASLAHSPAYVERFFKGETTKDEQRRTGFHWTLGLASRVRYETGGTVLASRVALERGIACSTAGGTHHAGPDYGSGYCLINDLAIAAKYLRAFVRCDLKILIVDLDVHQGDGTALLLQDEPEVFTFSMHCAKNFPFRKQESDLDVELMDGTGDEKYMQILQMHLPYLLKTVRPDLVLYDAGVDVHEDDDLGRISLSDDGLMMRDLYVVRETLKLGIPICTVIGGGYHRSLDVISRRHSIIHRAATKVYNEANP